MPNVNSSTESDLFARAPSARSVVAQMQRSGTDLLRKAQSGLWKQTPFVYDCASGFGSSLSVTANLAFRKANS